MLNPDFWRRVDVRGPDECWPWTGYVSAKGYGRLRVGGRTTHAHRLAFSLTHKRTLGVKEVVCHHCDNPPCCNPAHLFVGSVADNNRDKAQKGRARTARRPGAANPNARLSQADVIDIRSRIARGETNMAISRDYPVSHSMISRIKTGKAW
ncbi:HNH endonuclease [Brucella anthropi]|uniref:HNH endonuclease n=1 Tax=Brucella anthropi TaxID=529 RepID=UPI001CFE9D03